MQDSAKNSLLVLDGVSKAWPGVKALQDVRLELFAGEIHALIGENGAGKSTLLKILFGVHPADTGTLHIEGKQVKFSGPGEAIANGISMVHQELSLVPQLNSIQNIMLGRERSVVGFINWVEARKQAMAALQLLNFTADPNIPVRRLSIGQQQLVELARALAANAKVIIMDEPTASLSGHESEKLFNILRELRNSGHSIVYVSHRLAEVLDLADRATVLRDGKLVGTLPRGTQLTERSLVQMMVGRSLDNLTNLPHTASGEIMLQVNNISRQKDFQDVSFFLQRNEIVGMAGMIGAGRTEIARCIAGADMLEAGTIVVRGKQQKFRSPADSVRAGIAFLTEDRKNQGLALRMSLAQNITLPAPPTWLSFINRRKQNGTAKTALAKASSKVPVGRRAGTLSGGNQQKVVLAKWLRTKSEIFIFDEPTRGIDVGAKAEIYALMRELADKGAAILMISSEMPELLRMSDRIIVMREGKKVAEMKRAEASEEIVVACATGASE